MGANGDAGSATIGSPLHSWAALHADDPVLATWRDDLWLIFDSRPHIGSVDLQVQVKQVDPSEIGTVLTKVNADGLRNGRPHGHVRRDVFTGAGLVHVLAHGAGPGRHPHP